jgi:dihydrofolate synthase/folylpolyglutamate synthase
LIVLEEEAAAVGCELVVGGRDFEWSFRDGTLDYRGPHLSLDEVPIGMVGAHQGHNAACALASVEAFCHRTGLRAPDPWQVATALRDAKIPGRLERMRVPGAPAFLFDGAHNPAAAEALAAVLADRRRPPRRVWLVASMKDKDRASMNRSLLPHIDEVVCTVGESSPRFEDPEVLVKEFTALGVKARAVTPAREAVRDLSRSLGMRDEVLVAGSLYLVGDVRDALGFKVT